MIIAAVWLHLWIYTVWKVIVACQSLLMSVDRAPLYDTTRHIPRTYVHCWCLLTEHVCTAQHATSQGLAYTSQQAAASQWRRWSHDNSRTTQGEHPNWGYLYLSFCKISLKPHHVGTGQSPHPCTFPLSTLFFIIFYFSLFPFSVALSFFLAFSILSHSIRIVPLCFQALSRSLSPFGWLLNKKGGKGWG